ncbi:hypothetical protein ACFWY9_15410 [Amycolatopsis sp. NPDC059027]|uniref:hypothetical protein n=1 Tax=unclassified Amycolatopsis TaxID=2618356 RepID=UPI00366A6478
MAWAREPTEPERVEITRKAARARVELGLRRYASPRRVVRAVAKRISRRRTTCLGEDELVAEATALGYLLGEQWRLKLGWRWRYVTDGAWQGFAVTTADEQLVYPCVSRVMTMLADQNEEVNVVTVFKMVAAGNMPPARPSGFQWLS